MNARSYGTRIVSNKLMTVVAANSYTLIDGVHIWHNLPSFSRLWKSFGSKTKENRPTKTVGYKHCSRNPGEVGDFSSFFFLRKNDGILTPARSLLGRGRRLTFRRLPAVFVCIDRFSSSSRRSLGNRRHEVFSAAKKLLTREFLFFVFLGFFLVFFFLADPNIVALF